MDEARRKTLEKDHRSSPPRTFDPLLSKSFTDMVDRLSYIEEDSCVSTQSLIDKTSLNIVKCGVRVFRIMREIQGSDPLRQPDIDKAAKTLRTGENTLLSILQSDPVQALRIAVGQFQNPAHHPPDRPIHILVYFLRSHLMDCTRRPNNEIISGFLLEQDITETVEPSRVTKICKSASPTILRDDYEFYREVYEHSELPMNLTEILQRAVKRVVVDNPEHMRDVSLFPSWMDFLPIIKE
jgi:hypothetical protein